MLCFLFFKDFNNLKKNSLNNKIVAYQYHNVDLINIRSHIYIIICILIKLYSFNNNNSTLTYFIISIAT